MGKIKTPFGEFETPDFGKKSVTVINIDLGKGPVEKMVTEEVLEGLKTAGREFTEVRKTELGWIKYQDQTYIIELVNNLITKL